MRLWLKKMTGIWPNSDLGQISAVLRLIEIFGIHVLNQKMLLITVSIYGDQGHLNKPLGF